MHNRLVGLIGLFGLLVLLDAPHLVRAAGPVPVTRSGLAGIAGFYFYDPYCAHGCFRSFAAYTLACSDTVSPGGHTTAEAAAHALALCRASNMAYLGSIAWCMHLYCPNATQDITSQDVRPSALEAFWETEITGDITVLPAWSYGAVLANVTAVGPPTQVITAEDKQLDTTMLTTYDTWQATWVTLYYFFRETNVESVYGLALCLTLFGLPILLTWLGYLPYMSTAYARLRPWLDGSLVGTYHDRPLPLLIGNAPTAGQGLYVALLILLNAIFLGVGYETAYPNQTFQWYSSRYEELMAYVMWRSGVLAFCQMPVLILFSTRNNLLLLWLANWSHATYMLLHRWVARMFLLQTLLHSLLSLVLYQHNGTYDATLKTAQWWAWGCVATVAAVALIPASVLVLRMRAYELFLVVHIVLAVICVVGCWYHVWIGYENTFGYETWLYATVAVWFADRLARVGRMLKHGLRRATVTDLGPTLVRIDIPGIRWAATPGHCVYAYFPTAAPWRPWENHPFSTIPTSMLTGVSGGGDDTSGVDVLNEDNNNDDTEKNAIATASVVAPPPGDQPRNTTKTAAGLTLLVRKQASLTRRLAASSTTTTAGLLTLLDGPYPMTGSGNNGIAIARNNDRLLLVAGGIGITALLPFLGPACRHPNTKLLFSIRAADEAPLLGTLAPVLDSVRDKVIRVSDGQTPRWDMAAILQEEASLIDWRSIGVVVCGPPAMCDDVRAAVVAVGRAAAGRCRLELEVHAFSW